jgi:hypothetical protein
MKRKIGIEKTRIRNPDFVELGLIGILVVWSLSAFMLLQQAADLSIGTGSLLSWTSLTTFFTGIISIVLIVIAVILADMRKEFMK